MRSLSIMSDSIVSSPWNSHHNPQLLNGLQEELLVREEEDYIRKLKQRYIVFSQIQSKILNVVILLLLLLNVALYTDMFSLIYETFLTRANNVQQAYKTP